MCIGCWLHNFKSKICTFPGRACQYHTGELLPVGVVNDVMGNGVYGGCTELVM